MRYGRKRSSASTLHRWVTSPDRWWSLGWTLAILATGGVVAAVVSAWKGWR